MALKDKLLNGGSIGSAPSKRQKTADKESKAKQISNIIDDFMGDDDLFADEEEALVGDLENIATTPGVAQPVVEDIVEEENFSELDDVEDCSPIIEEPVSEVEEIEELVIEEEQVENQSKTKTNKTVNKRTRKITSGGSSQEEMKTNMMLEIIGLAFDQKIAPYSIPFEMVEYLYEEMEQRIKEGE